MSGEVTARDRVWGAVVRCHNTRFQVSDVRREIERDEFGEVPNDETIRRVLRAATALDVLNHESGSPYYQKKPELRKRFPVS